MKPRQPGITAMELKIASGCQLRQKILEDEIVELILYTNPLPMRRGFFYKNFIK